MARTLRQLHELEAQRLFKNIQQAAYRIYLDRNQSGKSGDADGDWYEAERYVREHIPYRTGELNGVIRHQVWIAKESRCLPMCPVENCWAPIQVNGQNVGVGLHRCECCGEVLELVLWERVPEA